MFRTPLSETIFRNKYAQGSNDTWKALANRVTNSITGKLDSGEPELLDKDERSFLEKSISEFKFIPGGRYLYYAGRQAKFYNNCYLLRAEDDTREEWSNIAWRAMSCLMTGGGIGIDYCLAPGTKILLSSLDWKNVEDLKINEEIVGFNENVNLQKTLFEPAKITYVNKNRQPCYKIVTDKGEIISSDKHLYVVLPGNKKNNHKGKGYRWIETQSLEPGDSIAFGTNPWEQGNSFEDGWMSGIFDGEGWNASSFGVAQKEGEILDRILLNLNKNKIEYKLNKNKITGVVQALINKKWHQSKVLGIFKPQRLLKKQHPLFGAKLANRDKAIVLSIEFIGEQEVIETGTSTRTLIANGFFSHNSRIRGKGNILKRTGGIASGPIPLMHCINEIGRNVMQGGSRRSAIYASLNWKHSDIFDFLKVKNWDEQAWTGRKTNGWLKQKNFNFPAPLDMTNISINYDTEALQKGLINNPTFLENCKQAMFSGEPGFSFNFFEKENETLRNACTEVTSEDDSDVCNLGSINIANIESLEEFKTIVSLSSKFLVCGTLRADLPYDRVYEVRGKNRRLGLGLMGIHEWLLRRGYHYEVTDELRKWLQVYKDESERSAREYCEKLSISSPVAFRAIAPTGTIGLLAGTTTGIEPLFAVAYKRRYLTDGTKWKYQYEVSPVADYLIKTYELKPDAIETALSLSRDYERRIKLQADIQDYVDMSISSTINLSGWGTEDNNESKVEEFSRILATYAPRLRGFTCYPDGSRGGQPITAVDYETALKHKGMEFHEMDLCELGKGGICGI